MKTLRNFIVIAVLAFAAATCSAPKAGASPILANPSPCVNGVAWQDIIVPQAAFPYFTIIWVQVSC